MPAQLKRRALCLAAALCLLAGAPGSAAAEKKKDPPPEPKHVGYRLGSFVLRDYQPLQDETIRLIFTVHASVREENSDEFADLLAAREHRVRDQVLTATRIASQEELQDPDLRLLRRRIQLRLKHSLPELHIVDIFVSEFQLYRD